VHVHSPSRDHIVRKRRFLEGGRAARRWTAPTTAGRPCEMSVIGIGTAPRPCVSSPPHARRTARIVRDDRRCDSSRSAVGAASEAVVEARLPRRHATCTRRCNARESCRSEATQTEKSARCGPDPTRGSGGRQEPRTARHAARVVTQRNRAAETNPMNAPSGDFEKEKSRRVTSAEPGGGARENRRKRTRQPPQKPTTRCAGTPCDAAAPSDPCRLRRADSLCKPSPGRRLGSPAPRLRVGAGIGCRSAARYHEARKRHNEPIRRNAIAKRNTTKQHGAATQNDDTPHRDSDPLTQPCEPRTARETSRRSQTTCDTQARANASRRGTMRRHRIGTTHAAPPAAPCGGGARTPSCTTRRRRPAWPAREPPSPRNLTRARLDEAPRRRRLRLAGVRKPTRRAAPGRRSPSRPSRVAADAEAGARRGPSTRMGSLRGGDQFLADYVLRWATSRIRTPGTTDACSMSGTAPASECSSAGTRRGP